MPQEKVYKYAVRLIKLRGDKKYKYAAEIEDGGRIVTVRFGAAGYEDYTTHKDYDRMLRYCDRHRVAEDWSIRGIYTRGFWSRWLLWNQPGVRLSVQHLNKKFNINAKLCRNGI